MFWSKGYDGVTIDDLVERIFRGPCQFTLPHNILGIPAISLPLAMHSTGLPIGIQLVAANRHELDCLQLAYAYEMAMDPAWRKPAPLLARANIAK